MARPDSLDADPVLNHSRFGHAPALWLALPLLAGCALDAAFNLSAGWPLAFGTLAALGLWGCVDHPRAFAVCLVAAGVALGSAWHQLRSPPQHPIRPTRNYVEVSLRIERASPRRGGDSWTGMGRVTDRDGDLFRRRVAISARGVAPAEGAELKIAGHLSGLPDRPTGYDAWIVSQGATLKLLGGRVLGVLEPPTRFRVWCQAEQARIEAWLRALPWTDEVGGALLAATMLGRTALLPEDTRAAFAATGTLHLFAISGLHIAGMAAAMLWLARRLRLPELPAGLAVLGLLWLYVEVTGASPSSVRAWIMAAFLWGGQVGGRATPPLQSLALAAAVTLALTPDACRDPGFQLSYVAVLALITAGGPAAEICVRPTLREKLTPVGAQTLALRGWWRLRRFLLGGLCLSVAATTAGAPLTLGTFGSASAGGIFVNLFLVPLSELPLILGMVSTALSPWDALRPAAEWINGLAALGLRAMAGFAELCAQAPGMNFTMELSRPWLGPAGAALLAAVFLAQAEEKSLLRLLGVPLAGLLAWLLLAAL